ncbi:DUF6470 family protein [Bacillus thermotolerans]|uniref:YviE n=1 Tax=Bacillus thermotolerans TaxID=1221996 RepID=A0A0F5I779_BACTR|nr:DUF6470 family protein [Bacillus thermotolerans]KKB41130.1 hypothetical protein QY95_00837 [Bacillus thermotolerans]
MQLPQIRLTSQPAQMVISTERPRQSIEQPKAELVLQQPKPELTIRRTPAKLTIDQTKAREDVDLKSVFRRTEEAAQLGQRDALQGIARRAAEGDELMRIENKSNPIPSHAKRNSEGPEKQFNIGWVPSHGSVKIDYTPGKVEIDVKTNPVINNTRPRQVIHDYEPGKVNITLKQHASLSVDFEGLMYKGIHYEQEI